MAARRAPTTGHNSSQVVVYSVHESNDVNSYTGLIDCRYILKGRPRELKEHVESTIHRKPTGWHTQARRTARTSKVNPKAKWAPKKKRVVRGSRKSFYLRYRRQGRASCSAIVVISPDKR